MVEPRTHTDYAGFEHPEVQRHIRQRYPEGLPEGEPVVAPVDLLVSDRVTRLGEVP